MDKSYTELIKPNKKDFWKNFWFYNKKIIITVIVTVVIVIFTVSRCINIPRADAGVLLITRHSRPPEVSEKLENELAAIAEDIDGDGKIKVNITEVYLPDTDSAELNASNEMKAVNELVNGDATIVIAEKSLMQIFFDEEELFEEIPQGDYNIIYNSQGKAVAIDISQNGIADKIEYHDEDILCLAVKSSPQSETAAFEQNKKLVQYIIKNK